MADETTATDMRAEVQRVIESHIRAFAEAGPEVTAGQITSYLLDLRRRQPAIFAAAFDLTVAP